MQKILESAKRFYQLKLNQILPEYKRYIFNDLKNSPAKITALYGSRGIGKTTLLMQVLKNDPIATKDKLYISCDHAIMKGISLFDFVDEFSKRGGQIIMIDEIHEAENFEKELKSIYDFLDVKVYFTGSSALHLSNPDFARRYSMYHLYPLSFREYLELTQDLNLTAFTLENILEEHEKIVSQIFEILKNKKILMHFDTFVNVGQYPFYFEDENKYVDRMIETINTVLHTDLTKLFNIQADKIDALKKLLLSVCLSKPLEMSVEKLAAKVGITKSTLYKYIEYLNDAELISHIIHEGKRFAALKKQDKLYLANTNLFNALCSSSEKGTLRETFFVSQVKNSHQLHYVDKGDFLVDEKFTIEIGGKNKGFDQIKDIKNSFVVSDDIETGFDKRIPLWLFGFLY